VEEIIEDYELFCKKQKEEMTMKHMKEQ